MSGADASHPDWLAVGSEVEVVRSFGRSVTWRRPASVVRQTKTLVVLDSGDRFRKETYGFNSSRYVLTPPYIDYLTVLAPLAPSGVAVGEQP